MRVLAVQHLSVRNPKYVLDLDIDPGGVDPRDSRKKSFLFVYLLIGCFIAVHGQISTGSENLKYLGRIHPENAIFFPLMHLYLVPI